MMMSPPVPFVVPARAGLSACGVGGYGYVRVSARVSLTAPRLGSIYTPTSPDARMPPATALERFVAPLSGVPAPRPKVQQPTPEMRVTPAQPTTGVLGQFFLQKPVDVSHPSVVSKVGVVDRKDNEISVARYGRIYKRKRHSEVRIACPSSTLSPPRR